jgi:hypothetical protein
MFSAENEESEGGVGTRACATYTSGHTAISALLQSMPRSSKTSMSIEIGRVDLPVVHQSAQASSGANCATTAINHMATTAGRAASGYRNQLKYTVATDFNPKPGKCRSRISRIS